MIDKDATARLERAKASLEGLSVGDSFGQRMFSKDVRNRELPQGRWRWTDDTAMAASVYWCLRKHGSIVRDELADKFAEEYMRQPDRGYGPAMHSLLQSYYEGAHWKTTATSLFGGTGSFGNGSAMRVPPLGAYFADTISEIAEQAKRSSEVTHSHPEAVAAAIAVALATGLACSGKSVDLVEGVIPMIPKSEVRSRLEQAVMLVPTEVSSMEAAEVLGNGKDISGPDTAPICIWLANAHQDSFEEALWETASIGGDVDTTCAIVGGILGARLGIEGIPAEWRRLREPLPFWALFG